MRFTLNNFASSLKGIKRWEIFAGLCVRRPAVITPELTPLEKRISEIKTAIEFENSHLSQHELRNKVDQEQLKKASEKDSKVSATEKTLLTAREQELIWESEAEHFKPAGRKTENDVSGNVRSAWRLLDQPLLLLTQSANTWNLPTISLVENKSLRQAADILSSQLLPNVAEYSIFGNAPSAVHVYRDRKSDDNKGIQIYFFNAYVNRLWNGEDLCLPKETDFAWICRTEMDKYITDKKLLKVLNSFIFEY